MDFFDGLIREEVARLTEQVLPKGRWILGSANTILPGTPVANVMAMLVR